MRIYLVGLVLLICIGGVAVIFWQQEMKYQLPTPVPVNYREVAVGSPVTFPSLLPNGKAHFIHFYNPDCPCSRFNAKHINALIHSYGDSVEFVIIVPEEQYVRKAASAFGDSLTILADPQGTIAKACGVYSTPQAAIIDHEGKLFYRGNYNSSRYCTTRASNFAELSLVALLNNRPSPVFGLLSTQSYGCEIQSSDSDSNLPELF